MGLSTIISLISTLTGGFKTYLYAGLAIAILAGIVSVGYKAYEYGATSAKAEYELDLAKLAQAQDTESKRQIAANQQAQSDLQTQLKTLQDENATLKNQLASNKQAAAKSPTAHTIAVPAASVQRLRAIRGH